MLEGVLFYLTFFLFLHVNTFNNSVLITLGLITHFLTHLSESCGRKFETRPCWSCSSSGVLGGNSDSTELVVPRQNSPVPHGSDLLRCLHLPPGGMCPKTPVPAT